MVDNFDTIAAVATASGNAGIAVIRLSGPDSLRIADEIFVCTGQRPSQRQAGTFVYGKVSQSQPEGAIGEGVQIDEAVLLIYRSPHSYTVEDVVELQCHGGRTSATRVLAVVLQAGARLAEPGEFTRRAFLNGRIDLLQAEAVADLIRARSERAAAAALDQLSGSLSTAFTMCYESLISISADIEASLDFADDELPDDVLRHAVTRLDHTLPAMLAMLDGWDEGHLLREGVIVVISGKPNVGKSTLMNRLLGTERAIVTDIPGTTRDIIEEQLILDGIPVRLVDTAGLRESHCNVEREGVRRAHERIRRADVNIHVVDASCPSDDDERDRLACLQKNRSLVAYNKTDLFDVFDQTLLPAGVPVVRCSLVDGSGVTELRAQLTTVIHTLGVGADIPHAVISERHRAILQQARDCVSESRDLLAADAEKNLVLASISLRQAIEALGTATGRTYSDDLLNTVFSRFCIGK